MTLGKKADAIIGQEIDPELQEQANKLFDETTSIVLALIVIEWLDTQDDLTAIDILDHAVGELATHEGEDE